MVPLRSRARTRSAGSADRKTWTDALMASWYRAPSGVLCLICWWLAICSTHIDSVPFQTMSALVSPVCSVSSRRTGYATRRSSSSASSGPATAISPRPRRKRRVSGSRSTRCSCSNVARIRETVLLCRPTRLAISVTPSSGSSAVKDRSTAMALTMTEVPLVSPFPLVSGVSSGLMVIPIIPHGGRKAAPRGTWRRFIAGQGKVRRPRCCIPGRRGTS